MSLWADYLSEKEGRITIENEHGFISLTIVGDLCMVQDFYVTPSRRGTRTAFKLLTEALRIANGRQCVNICGEIYRSMPSFSYVLDLHKRWGMEVVDETPYKVITNKRLEHGQITVH